MYCSIEVVRKHKNVCVDSRSIHRLQVIYKSSTVDINVINLFRESKPGYQLDTG